MKVYRQQLRLTYHIIGSLYYYNNEMVYVTNELTELNILTQLEQKGSVFHMFFL